MRRANSFFDRTGAVKRPPLHLLLREGWSRLAYRPEPPDPATLPPGRGHIVLVIPGFLTADVKTSALRRFLARCGYRPHGWGLGPNVGPTPRILAGLRRRVAELRAQENGPISLVGVSLGGLLARNLALEQPADIRHVVTLVAPVRLPTATQLEPLFHVCGAFYCPSVATAELHRPLGVPSTAIFTRDDGMVAWESCVANEPLGAAFEVTGAHVTICRNPDVLRIVAERLALD